VQQTKAHSSAELRSATHCPGGAYVPVQPPHTHLAAGESTARRSALQDGRRLGNTVRDEQDGRDASARRPSGIGV